MKSVRLLKTKVKLVLRRRSADRRGEPGALGAPDGAGQQGQRHRAAARPVVHDQRALAGLHQHQQQQRH